MSAPPGADWPPTGLTASRCGADKIGVTEPTSRDRPCAVRQLSMLTPIGELTLSEENGRIVSLDWGRGRDRTPSPTLVRALARLQAYFDGAEVTFDDLPLEPRGTSFQRRVWQAISAIPRGRTRRYGDIARALGSSPRAIGAACARNPLPILIPCHRVIGTAGRVGGYSGAEGADTKRFLLALEGAC